MKNAILVAAVGLTASVAMAQPGGTLTNDNMRFTIGSAPASASTLTAPSAIIFANNPVAGAMNPDHGFSNWWWFRRASDTREWALNSSGGGATSNFSGNSGTMTQFYGDFRADLAYETVSTGPGRGFVRSTLTVTNLTNVPLNLSLFNYADLDLNNVSVNNSATLLAPNLIRVSNSTGPYSAEYSGAGADFFKAGGTGSVIDLLTNSGVNDFDNSGLPFGGVIGGDFTAGFQWNLEVGPLFSRSVVSTISLVPTPGAMALLGLAGLMVGRRRRM